MYAHNLQGCPGVGSITIGGQDDFYSSTRPPRNRADSGAPDPAARAEAEEGAGIRRQPPPIGGREARGGGGIPGANGVTVPRQLPAGAENRPESSQPPHCSTRLPNCLHSPACECVCVYSVSHREAEEVEEKEKEESTGRDRCGAHTHSHSVTLSERVSLAHTHAGGPRSAQDPERRGKVAPAFSPGLRALGRALAPRLRGACGILPSRLRTSGAPAAAAVAPGTVGGLDNNSGCRLRPGAPSRCPPRSRDPSRSLPPPDARLPACNASARERLLPCPPWGLSRARSAKSIPPAGVGRGAGAEPAAPSRADPGTYKAGAVPARDGMRVGPVRSAMSGASQPRGPALLLPAARGAPAKRLLDADDAAAVAAKCPRLSECSSPPDYLSPPGSPCSPQPPPAAPGAGGASGSAPGPSRIADYLLLPLAEREHVSRALCIHTGRELRCKPPASTRRLQSPHSVRSVLRALGLQEVMHFQLLEIPWLGELLMEGPESSQPPHCSTRLPNCLHSPACECVCVYSVSHREAEEVEEKEKEESTGRDRCGAHTHSHSVTLSERVSLAHTHAGGPRSAQDPERRGKVAPAFSPGLRALGRALAPRLRGACGILPSRLRTSGAPAAAAVAPGTVGGLDNNSGCRLRPGAPSRCPPRSRDPSRSLPPPDARLPACNASARERLLPCPPPSRPLE
ncbi:PREDICTED: uncharacterized protein LOC101364826 [Odobenus rosmarus divergens]|uniref:Uncharacterized protein LOC101364826 n=1 Tax=Odobenus rosmarus divergens TaxID=9708 RepID=A0A9B0LZK1_ODORO